MSHLLDSALNSSVHVVSVSISNSLAVKEFRNYEAKIEESEKAGSRRESNPGDLWLEPPVLCY